ncbi:DUF2515 domain-containing protein [Robertmurraya yapensis]|uniref:DUF2515 domain-containing protein n=1 Tax=Bacillus yapensis TaxID=2492960 RepID=A0A3S0ICF5_9BACI|nr:DUF2515 domain-containing protein [Bacillus yapensis]TKS95290.1 DUF2515 domain-containing protein [Bacillus yapensis]
MQVKRVVLIYDPNLSKTLTASEKKIVHDIAKVVKRNNIDNISRTEAYLRYYNAHSNIKWSFLAHMVSRNAGWNMGDLQGKWFPLILDKKKRAILFRTYERANWLIFHDAYPQLLLYHYSTKNGAPMFHLLPYFHVSQFMVKEWNRFWEKGDRERLLTALIINEQNLIQKPVVEQPRYKKNVFHTLLFDFQDWFHYSCVLLPTMNGRLYGSSVHGFRTVDRRIDLGKKLSATLFNENYYPYFYEFATNTSHSGSRFDYEQYVHPKPKRTTPYLRVTFPIIDHHIQEYEDWSETNRIKRKWFAPIKKHSHATELSTWYKKKQTRLHRAIILRHHLKSKFESLGFNKREKRKFKKN